MSAEDVLREYQGHVVPQSYNVGFVVLSYVVSLIGAASTLELINRRTGFKGVFNHLLLLSSAVTMGGIAIWCMHFIGNRAIDLANGEPELQVAYSSGFTAVSFFVPILVLLTAFIAVGSNNVVSWWRVTIGGVLCGAAVCGMHYLGNASISNYVCIYRPAYVVGAAIIAVVASTVALAVFFVFRAMWASSWWKRTISAVVLAGAVSGMHWCAAVGTKYRLVSIRSMDKEPSRIATVVVVICLSIGACFIIAGSAILRARNMRKHADRAQQVTLGAAIFDKSGRILVDTDGFVPSAVVTDSFLERNAKEGFGISHPLFHWMFQASRNWNAVATLIGGMRHHLAKLPNSSNFRDGYGIQLINEHGEMIDGYEVIFRELFCLAASALSDRLREPLSSVGVLWDQVLPTGACMRQSPSQLRKQSRRSPSLETSDAKGDDQVQMDMAEKGFRFQQEELGRGSLMFLVRRIEADHEAERLVSAGYRFADLHQVSDIIRSSMQIQAPEFELKLRDMAAYGARQSTLEPGVHLGLFAIRARVNLGFEVLVRRGTRNMLPSMKMPLKRVEPWHVSFLKQFEGLPVHKLVHALADATQLRPSRDHEFASQLEDAIRALQEWLEEPLFEDAVLTPTIVRLPYREEGRKSESFMMTLKLVIPIHSMPSGPNCELVPFTYFKMRQVADQDQQRFMREVHREFAPIAKSAQDRKDGADEPRGLSSKLRRFGRAETPSTVKLNGSPKKPANMRRTSSTDSTRSSSTINLCSPGGGDRAESIDTVDDARGDGQQAAPSYGGIMVFQEISVDVEDETSAYRSDSQDTIVEDRSNGQSRPSAAPGIEMRSLGLVGTNVHVGSRDANNGDGSNVPTFVDILFAECVENR